MVAGGEDRVDAHGGVEVLFRSSEVSEIVFCDAAEKVVFVICRVQTREDVEVLYGLGKLAVSKSGASTIHEHVLVVLGESRNSRKLHRKNGGNHVKCGIKCFSQFAHREKITTFGGVLCNRWQMRQNSKTHKHAKIII